VAATYKGDSPVNSGALEADRDTPATGINRREHTRIRPDGKNQLAATLASGSEIRLIDLSKGGAQFECDRRFLPNATVSLRLVTRDGEVLVTGRVVRSRIVRLASGGLGYLVAVAFAKPLQTDLDDGASAAAPAPAPSAPAAQVNTAAAPAPVAGGAELPAIEAAPVTPSPALTPTPAEPLADISAEEALAFEATLEAAPMVLTVTASVDTTSDQLHDMFDGNDW